MKAISFIVALIAAALAAFAWTDARSDREARAADEAVAQERAAASQKQVQTLDTIVARLDDLERRMAEAPSIARAAAVAEPQASDGAGAATSKSGAGAAPPAAKADDPIAAAKQQGFDFDAALLKLSDPNLRHDESEALWAQIAKLGLVDLAIASLEEKVELDPSNPDLRLELASGYLQKLYGSKNQLEVGGWAVKMDQCYDAAIQHDPGNWEAQFSKAISYSFWPAITGKPQESVKIFEGLIAQQESKGDLQPQYADSYLLLGNLYKQQGKLDLAAQTYKKGASLFPDHGDLKSASESN